MPPIVDKIKKSSNQMLFMAAGGVVLTAVWLEGRGKKRPYLWILGGAASGAAVGFLLHQLLNMQVDNE